MDKKRVCVVGATGSVGQEFIQSLNNHPWFELTQIAASPKSAGKNYLDAIKNDKNSRWNSENILVCDAYDVLENT